MGRWWDLLLSHEVLALKGNKGISDMKTVELFYWEELREPDG
jgi:hypothetical protein